MENELLRIYLEDAKEDCQCIGIFKKNEDGEYMAVEDMIDCMYENHADIYKDFCKMFNIAEEQEIDTALDTENGEWIKIFNVNNNNYMLEIV